MCERDVFVSANLINRYQPLVPVGEEELLFEFAKVLFKESADENDPEASRNASSLLGMMGVAVGAALLAIAVLLMFARIDATLTAVVAICGIVLLVIGAVFLLVARSRQMELDEGRATPPGSSLPASPYPGYPSYAAHPQGYSQARPPADGIDGMVNAGANLVSTTIHSLLPTASPRQYQPAPPPSATAQAAAAPPSLSVLDRGDHYEALAWVGTDDWARVRWRADAEAVHVWAGQQGGPGAPQGWMTARVPGPFDAGSAQAGLSNGWLSVRMLKVGP